MGCAGAKESLEDKILLMKLDLMEIQMEKEKEIKRLFEMHGEPVKIGIVPDYIDPVFAKEKNIYDGDEYMLNVLKTDDIIKSINIKSVRAKSCKDVKAITEVGNIALSPDKRRKAKKNSKS